MPLTSEMQHVNQFHLVDHKDTNPIEIPIAVKLQWIREPPREVVVSVNQEIKVDCLALGEPKPSIRWEKLIEPTSFNTRLNPNSNPIKSPSSPSK